VSEERRGINHIMLSRDSSLHFRAVLCVYQGLKRPLKIFWNTSHALTLAQGSPKLADRHAAVKARGSMNAIGLGALSDIQ